MVMSWWCGGDLVVMSWCGDVVVMSWWCGGNLVVMSWCGDGRGSGM